MTMSFWLHTASIFLYFCRPRHIVPNTEYLLKSLWPCVCCNGSLHIVIEKYCAHVWSVLLIFVVDVSWYAGRTVYVFILHGNKTLYCWFSVAHILYESSYYYWTEIVSLSSHCRVMQQEPRNQKFGQWTQLHFVLAGYSCTISGRSLNGISVHPQIVNW